MMEVQQPTLIAICTLCQQEMPAPVFTMRGRDNGDFCSDTCFTEALRRALSRAFGREVPPA